MIGVLHNDVNFKQLPVIVLSGFARTLPEKAQQALDTCAVQHVFPKPFPVNPMRKVLMSILD